MAEEAIAADAVTLHHRIDARYRGQSYELTVDADGWIDAFHASHEVRYGYALRHAEVEAVTLRVEALAPGAALPEPRLPRASTDPPHAGVQQVWTTDGTVAASVHERDLLGAGHRIDGPAIITEYSGTTWIAGGWTARVLECGSLLLDRFPADPRGSA